MVLSTGFLIFSEHITTIWHNILGVIGIIGYSLKTLARLKFGELAKESVWWMKVWQLNYTSK